MSELTCESRFCVWAICAPGGRLWARGVAPEKTTSGLLKFPAREGGRLIGTAPFFLSSKDGSQPALRFVGSVEVSDYLDFLAAPEALDKFLNGLFAFLRQDPELGAYPIELFNLREDSLSMLLLPRAAELNGYTYAEEPCSLPLIPLGKLEAYWPALPEAAHKIAGIPQCRKPAP